MQRAGFSPVAEAAGVRSCWSEPIVSSRGQVLGTFPMRNAMPGVAKVIRVTSITLFSSRTQ